MHRQHTHIRLTDHVNKKQTFDLCTVWGAAAAATTTVGEGNSLIPRQSSTVGLINNRTSTSTQDGVFWYLYLAGGQRVVADVITTHVTSSSLLMPRRRWLSGPRRLARQDREFCNVMIDTGRSGERWTLTICFQPFMTLQLAVLNFCACVHFKCL